MYGENTGDMVGPGIRTQDLSDESLTPYRSELSGQPIPKKNGLEVDDELKPVDDVD